MQQVLEDKARQRLENIASVKPEKAEMIENIIIGNMQRGTVQGKISESQLIDLMEQYNEKEGTGQKVEFKRTAFDSDDDLDLDNLDL